MAKKYDLSAFDRGASKYDLSAFDKGAALSEDTKPGTLESLLRGAGQGATLGFADELTGGGEALGDLLSGKTDELGGILEAYRKHRDESRAAYQAAEEENPLTYNLANLAGSFAIPAGALGAAGKAATFGERALAGFKAGALAGGLGAMGGSQKDATQGEAIDLAKEGIGGALLGGGLGAGANAILPVAGKAAGDWLKEFKGTQQISNAFQKARAGEEMFGTAAATRETEKTKDVVKQIGKVIDEVRDYSGKLKGKALESSDKIPIMDTYKSLNDKLDSIVPASADEERLITKYKSMLNKLVGKETTKAPTVSTDAELSNLINSGTGDAIGAETGSTVITRPEPNAEEIQKTKDALGKILFKNKDLPYEGEQAGHEIRTELENAIKSGLGPNETAQLGVADKGYSKAIEAQSKIGGLGGKSGTSLDARIMYDRQIDSLVDTVQKTFIKPADTDAVNLKHAFDITKKNIQEINDGLIKITSDPEEIAKLTQLKQEQLSKVDNIQKAAQEQGINMATVHNMMGESPFGGESLVKKLTGISAQASTLQTARKLGQATRLVETQVPEKIAQMSKAIFDASPESLQKVAIGLKNMGSPFADKLGAVLNQPMQKRNALLFTLMQQPAFREEVHSLFGGE